MTKEEARMTHGQRYQAAQDWREAQTIIICCIFALCLIAPIIETIIL